MSTITLNPEADLGLNNNSSNSNVTSVPQSNPQRDYTLKDLPVKSEVDFSGIASIADTLSAKSQEQTLANQQAQLPKQATEEVKTIEMLQKPNINVTTSTDDKNNIYNNLVIVAFVFFLISLAAAAYFTYQYFTK